MKTKSLLSLMIMVLIIGRVYGQGKTGITSKRDTTAQSGPDSKLFIKVTEIDEDGKRIDFKPGYIIVDPNSKLELKIDKGALASLDNSALSQDITFRMNRIKKVLKGETEVIKIVNDALAAYSNSPQKKGYFTSMQQLYPLTNVINRDPEARAIRARFGMPASVQQGYLDLVKTANLLLTDLQTRLLQEAKKNGTVVQLGAWLETKQAATPIHIPGFDTYEPQAPTTVERFQINLTADQKKELQEISSLVDTANTSGLPAVIKLAKASLTELPGSVTKLGSYDTLVMVYNRIQALAQHTNTELGGLKTEFDNLLKSVNDVKQLAEGIADKYAKPAAADNFQLLTQINDDAEQLLASGLTLKTTLVADSATIRGHIKNAVADLRPEITSLLSLFPKLYQSIIVDFKNIPLKAKDILEQLTAGDDLAASAHEFTEKVKQLSVDSLPDVAVVDLNTAGSRNLGDRVTIKLASGQAGKKLTERELLHYNLYFCKVYARTAVGFLFVSPTPSFKRSDDKAFFRYAPSYSILLKGFWKSAEQSRQSLNYHKLYAPGVGLNFSGLDFNGDGAVELGIGGVFTLFQDFLQLGYGINTESGRGYAFFGFKLPVGSFNIH